MAGAHELIGATIPRHHTAQVGADGIDAVVADRFWPFHGQIGGIALEALHQIAVTILMAGKPAACCNYISQFVFSGGAAAAAGSFRGMK